MEKEEKFNELRERIANMRRMYPDNEDLVNDIEAIVDEMQNFDYRPTHFALYDDEIKSRTNVGGNEVVRFSEGCEFRAKGGYRVYADIRASHIAYGISALEDIVKLRDDAQDPDIKKKYDTMIECYKWVLNIPNLVFADIAWLPELANFVAEHFVKMARERFGAAVLPETEKDKLFEQEMSKLAVIEAIAANPEASEKVEQDVIEIAKQSLEESAGIQPPSE